MAAAAGAALLTPILTPTMEVEDGAPPVPPGPPAPAPAPAPAGAPAAPWRTPAYRLKWERPLLHHEVDSRFLWEVDHDRFELERVVGAGAYGCVAAARDHASGKAVAIKKIARLFDAFESAKRIYREVAILGQLDHANVVRLFTVCPPRAAAFNSLYLVFERLDTDLRQLCADDSQVLTVPHVRHFLRQLLLAVRHLHARGCMHRDIKPANILLSEACDLRLCDFGLARAEAEAGAPDAPAERAQLGVEGTGHPPPARGKTLHVVTRWYRAPELSLYRDGAYTAAVDMWSVGCVLAELLGMLDTGREEDRLERRALFPGGASRLSPAAAAAAGREDQLAVIVGVLGAPAAADLARARTDEARALLAALPAGAPEDFARRFPTAPPEALDLLRALLRFSPEDRATVDAALAHAFLAPAGGAGAGAAGADEAAPAPVAVAEVAPETVRARILELVERFNPGHGGAR